MSSKKFTNEGAGHGSKVDDVSRRSRGPVRSHIWRYRWVYFLLLYLPVVIPVIYISITDVNDPLFSGSFISDSVGLLWFIAISSMVSLWLFSMFYLTAKQWRWLVALFLCPPLVFVYFLKDRD